MKTSRKSVFVFIGVWLMTVLLGFWFSSGAAFGLSGNCGDCAYCAQFYQIYSSQGATIGWTAGYSDLTPEQMAFGGFACQSNGSEPYYNQAQCLEGDCPTSNGVRVVAWWYKNASSCQGTYPQPYVLEATDGVSPYSPSNPPQYVCGSGS